MMETERLWFHRRNQKILRVESYQKLSTSADNGNTDASKLGKRISLPSSFTGEITRFLNGTGLHPKDRTDVVCKVFKMKLDHLIKNLKENKLFGRINAVVYTVEFQKKGLSHAHICIFMHQNDKLVNHEKIDDFISAEIPDKKTDPQLYRLVSDYMMHGPCGADNPSFPCKTKGKCTKQFPKKFSEHTTIDSDGFPIYKRPDNGRFIEKAKERRKQGYAVGRIHQVPYSLGEAYYLRVLLNKVKGKTSWEEIRTVDGKLYDSFRDACFSMGLLDDDKHIARPDRVWNQTWEYMSDDIEHEQRLLFKNPELEIRERHRKNLCLQYTDKLLRRNGSGRTAHSRFGIPINVNEDSFCFITAGSDKSNIEEIKEFGYWILKMGDGRLGGPNDGEATVDIPDDILVSDNVDPIASLIEFVYPLLLDNLQDTAFFQERAILAPTHEVIGVINDRLLSQISGEEVVYYSSDSICESEGVDNTYTESLYSPKVLCGLKLSGIPNHILALKVGAPVMLLRNINQTAGLCNGTRLRILKLGEHVIEAQIMTGTNVRHTTIIPRLKLSPSHKRLPLKINRRQFPLAVCFAMTINKSQGQSLSNVVIFLPNPVFTHGQFYVVVSRVKSRKGLKVLINLQTIL
uniref:Uncharacterized protein n=1 Tax=Tanacetum cinerariifolium TaxID=118510 RepID=A0A6L2L2E6_TANCI|nr:hypothetical protein [Tanacetum cinerariifolium]